jgi:hypothetical protein
MAVTLGPLYITVDCGTPQNYTRNGQDVTFNVLCGFVDSVDFPSDIVLEIDALFNDSGFQSEYVSWVNENIPSL